MEANQVTPLLCAAKQIVSQVKTNFLEKKDAPRDCLLTAAKPREERVIHTVEQRELLTANVPLAVQLYLNTSGSRGIKSKEPVPKVYYIKAVPFELAAKDIGFEGSDVVYDLYCSFVHRGADFDSGHWWSCVKTCSGWYEVNDSEISTIDTSKRNWESIVAPCRCVSVGCFAFKLMRVRCNLWMFFAHYYRETDCVSVSSLLYTQRK